MGHGAPGLCERRLFLQVANGDFHGMSSWLDLSPAAQAAAVHACSAGEDTATYEHPYPGGTTLYTLDLVKMMSTNMDSNMTRNLRWSGVLHW